MWSFTVAAALVFNCVFCLACAEGDSATDLRVLSKQVNALMDRRQEDVKSIEDHVIKAIFGRPEMMQVMDEIKKLRSDLDALSTGSPAPPRRPPADRNDLLTVKWLHRSFSELQAEVAELQASLNASAMLGERARAAAESSLLRSDVANAMAELEEVKARGAKLEAQVEVAGQEFRQAKENWRGTAVSCGKMENQLKAAQLEWNQNWKILNEKSPTLENEIIAHPSRHHRIMKQHVIRLEKSTKTLHKENYNLKSKLTRMEEEIRSLQKKLKWREELDSILAQKQENLIATHTQDKMASKMADIAKQQTINVNTIANLTEQMTNFDKLHLSMLELLENVETIENKVDKNVPEFRKEISKLEVQIAETSSAVSLVREDQKNVIDSMKAISFSVSNLQDKTNEDREKLANIDVVVKNLMKSASVQTSKLHDHILKEESGSVNVNATKATIHLVQELKSFESEYKSIVNKLPKDCSSVEGPPGIYLISPGEAEPILAHCEDGWTTVQKRYDGSLNFNRNWNEYSNGFGSATGEHWLGNKNLHSLTKMNCSRLQINMKDIYGKYWQANYEDFRVEDYSKGFKLYINRYQGNASDAMDYQNLMEFSTVDNDRDISNTHCASNYEGGWWFSHCQHANLNGRYNLGLTWFDSSRNEWIAVANSEMRVKRRDVC